MGYIMSNILWYHPLCFVVVMASQTIHVNYCPTSRRFEVGFSNWLFQYEVNVSDYFFQLRILFIFYTAFYVMNFLYYEYKPIKEE